MCSIYCIHVCAPLNLLLISFNFFSNLLCIALLCCFSYVFLMSVGVRLGAATQASSSSPSRGIVLGASHESALGDGLKPLHLALLQKDLVTDASRRYFAMNGLKDHENSASHSSSSSSSSLSSTTISSKVSTTSSEQVDPSSPVAAVLRRLMVTSSPSEDTLGSPLSHRVISAAAVQAAVHQEVPASVASSALQIV